MLIIDTHAHLNPEGVALGDPTGQVSPLLIDTHAHLNFVAFKEDVDDVVSRCLKNKIWIINVGTKYETSKRAVEIAQSHKQGVYAAVGLHPIHLETGLVKIKNDTEETEVKTREEDFDYEKYKELAKNRKVVAIGEVGLDYWYKPKTKIKLQQFKEKQRIVLCQQLNLAKELNLPLIFHCRLAHQDLIEILKSKTNSKLRGVIHCFTGNWEETKRYLELGFYLGFNGIIFKFHPVKSDKVGAEQFNRVNLDEVIKNTPLDKILIETDCPYLTPPLPRRSSEGAKAGRNEPLYLKYIVEKIAKIKGVSFEEIAKRTSENARSLFNI